MQGGAKAGSLADQEDPRDGRVGLGVAGDRDRFALIEVAGEVAAPASPEAGVEGDETRSMGSIAKRISMASTITIARSVKAVSCLRRLQTGYKIGMFR